MWWPTLLVFFSANLLVYGDDSLVVTSTEATNRDKDEPIHATNIVNPQIYSMQINSNVSNRFAKTLITSKVRNLKNSSQETTFSVIIPENAFISEFEMEIKDKVYKAYVKEKEEAKQIYQQAVAQGQSAAHVELSARDSKTFTVSVNIEPESKTIFRLVYEELLQRQLGQYELVINIRPGQTVEDLGVQVNINESRPLTFVRTPPLRTGNEIGKNTEGLEPNAEINQVDTKKAVIKFKPSIGEQKEFGVHLGGDKENGLAGQFVVQYDVERDSKGGEVLVRDGYFVHFFAPSELKALPKHVVFVLDHSGSMAGRKFEQLVEAMQNILTDLSPEDLFDIVRFSDQASVWDVKNNTFKTPELLHRTYGALEPHLREAKLPETVKPTPENISKAKAIINDTSDMGSTNIIEGLEVGIFLIKRTQEVQPGKYQPMIVFLTDGFPNGGLSDLNEILKTVITLNTDSINAAIFSLSFGVGADKDFLRKLSQNHHGFSRHIYEASDASLQLQDFYKTISSPILSNVTFNYVDDVSGLTKTHFPILFKGGEIVVAGKTENKDFDHSVTGWCGTDLIYQNLSKVRTEPVTSLERLWAYLTVKQILAESETGGNNNELKKKALDLALKYSFVTPVSSLVVVKPNETLAAEPQTGSPESDGFTDIRIAGGSPGLAGIPGSAVSYRSYLLLPVSGHAGRPAYAAQPLPQQFYLTTPFVRPHKPLVFQDPIPPSVSDHPEQNATIPQWLIDLKNQNANITTPTGSFKLGQSGDDSTRPDCSKTPINGTRGVCTLIFDCPQLYPHVNSVAEWLPYFCPLNAFAGICCPLVL